MTTTPGPWRIPVAEFHEARLLLAANPALLALVTLGRTLGPVRRVPRLGWVVTSPKVARGLLADTDHVSLLGEGGVGHLWAQVLGDWVNTAFEGAGHSELRSRAKDLFTDASAKSHVTRVLGEPAARLTRALDDGEAVDMAATARAWVGRIVADLLGIRVDGADHDAPFHDLFACARRLTELATQTMGSTHLEAAVVDDARGIIETLTEAVPHAYATAGEDTLLGRCRAAGVTGIEARGLASLLLVAGTETSAAALCRGIALLHDSGNQTALADNRALLPSAVREILRVTTPAPLIGRHVTADGHAGGRTLRKGDRVMLLTYVANNAVGRFDITRPLAPEIKQLWFGAGPHLCLGAPLARAEMTLLLEALLATGRPWRVVRRRPARRVVIPTYAELTIVAGPAPAARQVG